MPTLHDILYLADLASPPQVKVHADACVLARSKNASCRKCAQTCVAGCIEAGPEGIKVNSETCVNCGACSAVCPTCALQPLDPTPATLLNQAEKLAERHSTVAFACSRFASATPRASTSFAVVPCLCHITEKLVCSIAELAPTRIALIDGDCETCGCGWASVLVDVAIENAQMLLDSVGSTTAIDRLSFLPSSLEVSDTSCNDRGAERRALLQQSAAFLREFAEVIGRAQLDHMSFDASRHNRRSRVALNPDGSMALVKTSRNESILDSLYAIGEPLDASFSTRLFGTVALREESCNGCGLCVHFCPTAALSKSRVAAADGKQLLEFRAAECVQCQLCSDVCPQSCIQVSPIINTLQLFELEPHLFEVPQKQSAAPDLSHVTIKADVAPLLPADGQALRQVLDATRSNPKNSGESYGS